MSRARVSIPPPARRLARLQVPSVDVMTTSGQSYNAGMSTARTYNTISSVRKSYTYVLDHNYFLNIGWKPKRIPI